MRSSAPPAFVDAVRTLPTSGDDIINRMKLNAAVMRAAGFEHLLL